MLAGTIYYPLTIANDYTPMPIPEQKHGETDSAMEQSLPKRNCSIKDTMETVENEGPELFHLLEWSRKILCIKCSLAAQEKCDALRDKFIASGSFDDRDNFKNFFPVSDEDLKRLNETDFNQLCQWIPFFRGHQWKLFELPTDPMLELFDTVKEIVIRPEKSFSFTGKWDYAIWLNRPSRRYSVQDTREYLRDADSASFRVFELARGILCPHCFASAKTRRAALKQQFWLSGETQDAIQLIDFHPLSDEQLRELIQTDFDQLYQWMLTFDAHQWNIFTLPDLQRIDFTKLIKAYDEQTKNTIVPLISTKFYRRSMNDYVTLLSSLNGENLTVLFPFFEREHLQMLTPEQIDTIDSEKIANINRQHGLKLSVAQINFALDNVKLLPSLNGENLTAIFFFFGRKHLQMLTPEQIDTIDFEKIVKNIRQHGLKLSADQSNFVLDNVKLLSSLNGENLTILFPFFERKHLQMLTPEQIDTIDFEKIANNCQQNGLKLSADQSNFALVNTQFRMRKVTEEPKTRLPGDGTAQKSVEK